MSSVNKEHFSNRFKDAPWYTKAKNETILVVGCGGIASNALYLLTKTIPAHYFIMDFDKVEAHNVNCQFFFASDLGKFKVNAFKERMENTVESRITPLADKYKGSECLPIMISGLDNMKTRKEMFEAWRKQENRELLIEARLRATQYEVYAVTKEDEAEYEKTLFDDNEVDEGPCTFKQTAHFGMLVGARITQILCNYLTNKYDPNALAVVPFKVEEKAEPFYFNIHDTKKF